MDLHQTQRNMVRIGGGEPIANGRFCSPDYDVVGCGDSACQVLSIQTQGSH